MRDRLTFQHPADAIKGCGAQVCSTHAVVLEGAVGGGDPVSDDFADGVGIDADFVLGMGVGAQAQEVEEVVQVYLPVPLGVDVGGQIHAGKLSREALLAALSDHLFIMVIAAHGIVAQITQDTFGFFSAERLTTALVVDDRLGGKRVGRGDVEFAIQDRVAGRVFVDVGGAVADPLAGDEDREFDVELDLAHLERGRVPVPHEIADEPFIILNGFGALAVADPRGLCYGTVVAHIVNDADKAVVEHG